VKRMECSGKLRSMASIYLVRGEEILLLNRSTGVAGGTWIAAAGGHFEPDELCDARACALRELEEELGLTADDLKDLALRYVTLRRTKDELRQNYYFFAELTGRDPQSSTEGTLRWFSCSELRALEMPVTAKFMLEHYLAIGRESGKVYGGVADGKAVLFTELPAF